MDKEAESPLSLLTPWYNQKFFRYAFAILLVLAIILLFSKIVYFLTPILNFLSTLFIPIVTSFLFYYLLRPIVTFFENRGIPRVVTILLIYLIIAVLFILFIAYLSPILLQQITELANTSVDTLKKAQHSSEFFLFNLFRVNLNEQIQQNLFSFFQQITNLLSQNFLDILGYVTRVAAIMAVTPFIVFYLLKDDHTFASSFLNFLPVQFNRDVKKILNNIDSTLSKYINGLVLVSGSLGVLLFFCYLVIGLDYALILSLIAIVFTTIPFLGPFLAIAPAIFVAFSTGPMMVLKVIVVFVIVQQCESNIISPQIIGQRLHMHPLTIILLLLAAGSLYGLLGLILATPMYAISKVLIENLYKIYRLHYGKK